MQPSQAKYLHDYYVNFAGQQEIINFNNAAKEKGVNAKTFYDEWQKFTPWGSTFILCLFLFVLGIRVAIFGFMILAMKKVYYDPKKVGIDIGAKAAKELVKQGVNVMWQHIPLFFI